jgi:hypothetical protein
MEERRREQQNQLEKLLRAIEVQNTMLAQVLAFIAPVADFFKALKVVVKVGAMLVAVGGFCYGVYEWVVFHFKH